MRLVFDAEADDLFVGAKNVWCIVAIDVDTEELYQFRPHEIEQGLALLSSADQIIGHNICGYDVPLFGKLYSGWRHESLFDTFIVSSLVDPDRPDGHSLGSYGKLFGRAKPVHEDWSQYSEAMLHRCTEDVHINLMLYRKLMNDIKGWDWGRSLELEHAIALIQAQQELNGVGFDLKRARATYAKINKEILAIEKELLDGLPMRIKQHLTTVNKPFLKSGKYSSQVTEWYEEPCIVGGPFTRITYEQMNLNSDAQIKEYLLSQGWVPTEWNYKKDGKFLARDENGQHIRTSPKLTEDSFDSVQGEFPRLITRRAVLVHRRGLIYNVTKKGEYTGWVNALRPDGRITAEGIPQATNTGRYRHKTVVNVPKASPKVIYGKEMRELFIPYDGYVQVGVDAVALENRVEGHFTAFYDGGEYAKLLLEGDPHTKNAEYFTKRLGIEVDRDLSKRIKYAITYGAQAAKIAATAGVSKRLGQALFDAFWEVNPALARLKADVEKSYDKRGFIKGIDGRKLIIRSKHAIVNTLFQNAGSLLVKQATIFTWRDKIPQHDLDAFLMIHQHDEWQASVNPLQVEKYIELCLESFVQSGQYFNMNIPIEGDAKVGVNWAECH